MPLQINPQLAATIQDAARLIRDADSLIITAGAGMGADSGLPDFRGQQAFWEAYPALGKAQIRFEEIANPASFQSNPELAWGFYGHRLNLYRDFVPHTGFQLLQEWADEKPYGAFVFTSNVDGHFERAGFDDERIIECHGSIHHLQCSNSCTDHAWEADRFKPVVDVENCRITSALPKCIFCREIARPNILMFGDFEWLPIRKYEQQQRFRHWREHVKNPVVIELGAGTAIPSVRSFGSDQHCPIVRLNPREWEVSRPGDIGIPLGAMDGLRAIQRAAIHQ